MPYNHYIPSLDLKETGAKTEPFRQRGNTELQHWTEKKKLRYVNLFLKLPKIK